MERAASIAEGAGLAGRGLAVEFVRRPGLALAALFVAALLVFLPGQTVLPVTDRDEARFAQASRQMLETGDFLDIRLQEQTRYNKPVGAYWLQAASAAAFGGAGAPIAAFRLPSLLAAAGAVALTAWAARPLVGGPAGLLAAGLLATSVLLNVEARIAKTDAMLLCVTVFAMGALARAALGPPGRLWPRAFWAAVGAGVLLKGPIILIPAAGALAGLTLARRSWGALRAIRPLEGLAVVLLIAGPWLVAITLKAGWAFWADSVGRDLLAKAASGQESHGAPPGYHTIATLVAFWPWAALVPFAALWVWARRRAPQTAFLLGWIGLVWLVFEATPTKLPHYTLPAYPALAMLLAAALLEAPRFAVAAAPGRAARMAALAGWGLPAAVLTLAAIAGPWAVEGAPSVGSAALGLAAGAAAVVAGAALWRWRLRAFLPAAAATSVLGVAALMHFGFPALGTAFVAPRLAAASAALPCASGPLALTGFREPSAVFHLGTDTRLTDGAGAAALLGAGAVRGAWVEARDLDAFRAAAPDAPALADLSGFNYSNGRRVHLTLHAPAGELRCDL